MPALLGDLGGKGGRDPPAREDGLFRVFALLGVPPGELPVRFLPSVGELPVLTRADGIGGVPGRFKGLGDLAPDPKKFALPNIYNLSGGSLPANSFIKAVCSAVLPLNVLVRFGAGDSATLDKALTAEEAWAELES